MQEEFESTADRHKEDWFGFRGELIRGVQPKLMAGCGEVYGTLVVECLSVEANASDGFLREMYAFGETGAVSRIKWEKET